MGWLNKLFNLDTFKATSDTDVPVEQASPVSYGNKGSQAASGNSASKRLKLVLMHDRTQLSPAMMEQMRDELVEVISKYVVIDKSALDINLESESNTIALVANIPVLRARTGAEETLTQQNLKQPSDVLPNAAIRQADATAADPAKVNAAVSKPLAATAATDTRNTLPSAATQQHPFAAAASSSRSVAASSPEPSKS